MNKRSKRYKNLVSSLTKDKKLTVKEILEHVKKNANTKFGTTVGVDSSINMLSIANQKRLYNELIHDDIFISA